MRNHYIVAACTAWEIIHACFWPGFVGWLAFGCAIFCASLFIQMCRAEARYRAEECDT